MPLLKYNLKDDKETVFLLKAGENRIGRSLQNDLVIEHSSVSSFHCKVVVDEGRLKVSDLRSTNGTFIGNSPILEEMIQSGQGFRVGEVEIRFEVETARAAMPPAQARSRLRELRRGLFDPVRAVSAQESDTALQSDFSLHREIFGQGPKPESHSNSTHMAARIQSLQTLKRTLARIKRERPPPLV